MSIITSPRESSVTGRRVTVIGTPTSSSRPSFECTRFTEASPNFSSDSNSTPAFALGKRSRAALREYYNLKSAATNVDNPSQAYDVASEASSIHDFPTCETNELDHEDFDAATYLKHILEHQKLTELLSTYNGVLVDIRALDAERKALVYDNYSKLITATETIERMRKSMESGEPVANTLDLVIDEIYAKAERLKIIMNQASDHVSRYQLTEGEDKKAKAKAVALRILDTPKKVRCLISEGNHDEAREIWESARTILQEWKDRNVGGPDVAECMEDGDAALRGEPPNENSWIRVKEKKFGNH